MKAVRLSFFAIPFLSFFLLGCPPPPKATDGYPAAVESKCPLPDTKWLKVVNGYSSENVLKLAGELKAAAKLDVERLKAIGSGTATADGSFSSQYANVVGLNSQQIFEVSQDFFEAYRARRDALCSILVLMDRPNIEPETKKDAEKLFLKISDRWSEVIESEEKKSSSH